MNYFTNKIKEFKKQIDDAQQFDAWTIYELKERTEVLKADYSKHECKNVALEAKNELTSEASAAFYVECSKIDDLYVSMKAKIEQRIEYLNKKTDAQFTTSKPNEQNAQTKQVANQIVPVCTRQFNGSMNQWLDFFDEAKEKIHDNEHFDEEQKMLQLTQVLSPELLSALKTVGFENTWKKLVNKYDNYRLANFYMQKMFTLEKIDQPSCDNITELLNRMDTIRKAFDKIEQVSVEHFMVFAITTKLDPETMRAWHRFRNVLAESCASKDGKEKREHMPSLESLLKFLDEEKELYANQMLDMGEQFVDSCKIDVESDALTNTKAISNAAGNYDASTSSQAMTNLKEAEPVRTICVLCPPNTLHPLYKCTRFLAKTIFERVTVLSEHQLCMRCFRADHSGLCTDPRSNKQCERCKPKVVYHNSTICEKNIFTVTPTPRNMQPKAYARNIGDDDDWTS